MDQREREAAGLEVGSADRRATPALLVELNNANAQLQEQALELELTNQQLSENAAELEVQAEELETQKDELTRTVEELAVRTVQAEAAREEVGDILESISDAFYALDGTWRFRYVNGQAERLLGHRREDLIGHSLWEALPDAVGSPLEERYRHAVAARETVHFEQFFPSLDTWFEVRAYPASLGLSVYFQDINERRRSERLAHFAAEIGRAVTRGGSLPEIMHRCCEAVVEDLGAAFARVWVLEADEPVLRLVASAGKYTHLDGPHGRVPVGQFKIGRIAAERMSHLTNAVADDPQVSDHAWATREGMIAFAGYPLVVDDLVVGVFAMFSRKVMTQREFETLATAADAVSVSVANARAFEAEQTARAAAQAANEAKSQFVAQMSHELRTPLNAIGGYAELMALGVHGPVTPAQLEALERIRLANQSLTALISDILSFAKVESGELRFHLSAVDLQESITAAVSLVERQAAMSGHTVVVEPTLGMAPTLWTDPHRLQQILLNLLTNAVKYTDGGTIIVCSEPIGTAYAVTVRDTGTGIAASQHEAIFDPFIQLDRSLTLAGAEVVGVGLGLSISRSLARALHGDLTVTSELGVGSAFTLVLPAMPT
ncbi:MAG: ATP-binding protein [Gemmatimonadota bacterium]|nr:ATP-binding protein [Gemmatimonadota bacterium]